MKRLGTRACCVCFSLMAACNTDISIADAGSDGGEGGGDMSSNDLAPRNRDAACASVRAEATLQKQPVDVIFVIDNSNSMTAEIQSVQSNINKNFADIIGKSGLDYRVILIARHGDAAASQSVCITAPLSGNNSCTPLPAKPANTARFYHYSVEIASHDSYKQLLATYTAKDEFNLAPGGWSQWLRPEAFKTFIEITDDESDTTAADFEPKLLALKPAMFGTAAARNYQFHTIAGLKENTPATTPWQPSQPVQTTKCTKGGGAVAPGIEYQNLSKTTLGLRFPICEYASFDSVFQEVAKGVVSGSKVACDFALPPPPANQKYDLSTITLEYTPGAGAVQIFKQVPSAAQCAAGSFYLSGDRVYLCPASCQTVQADTQAKVQVLVDCTYIVG